MKLYKPVRTKTLMTTISVVIAAKNEADKIRTCLDHVTFADEIIIIDNGSADNTVKICRQYTDKIYSYKKPALIPFLHNLGIQKATKEWTLILDADVIVPKEAGEEILKRIQNPTYVGYYLPHRMVAFGKVMKYALFCNILKLFRNGYGTFDCSNAHCTLKIKGKIGKIKTSLLHYAHPNIETFIRKMNLYTSQDAQKINETGKGGLLNKRLQTVTVYDVLFEPFLYALYLYTVKKYYKDGIYGLILSILNGYYLFVERAKVVELQNRKQP